MLSIIAAFAFAAAAPEAAGGPVDPDFTPAVPTYRPAPPYPASCTPPAGEPIAEQTVIVVYRVNRDGAVKDVRVRESSNTCFNDAALAAARGWRFAPARRKGERVEQQDIETTIRFQFDGEATTEDLDARPLVRLPPQYPQSCMRTAKPKEVVTLEFDVTPTGETANVRATDTTNPCLSKSAVDSVKRWKYRPKIVDGVAVERRGVQTMVTYELADGGFDWPVRRAFAKDVERVRKRIIRKDPPAEILADFDVIEKKYGADLTPFETPIFYQLRGAVRVDAGDYRGALDDLRIALASGGYSKETRESLQKMVEWLEAKIAAEDAAAPAAPTESPAVPGEPDKE